MAFPIVARTLCSHLPFAIAKVSNEPYYCLQMSPPDTMAAAVHCALSHSAKELRFDQWTGSLNGAGERARNC